MYAVGYPDRDHVSGAGLSIYGLAHADDARVRVQHQRRAVAVVADYRVRQRRVQVGVGGFQRGDQRADRYFLGDFVLDRRARPRRTVVVFVQNRHFHLKKTKTENTVENDVQHGHFVRMIVNERDKKNRFRGPVREPKRKREKKKVR